MIDVLDTQINSLIQISNPRQMFSVHNSVLHVPTFFFSCSDQIHYEKLGEKL